jgi:ATP-dependent DNA helicase RecG
MNRHLNIIIAIILNIYFIWRIRLQSNSSSLRKILDLEIKKSYQDTAIIGGLDKYLSRWAIQITNCSSDPKLLAKLRKLCPPNPPYVSMDSKDRKEWTGKLVNLLDDIETHHDNKIVSDNIPPEKNNIPKAGPNANKVIKPIMKSKISSNTIILDSSVMMVKGISSILFKKFEKLGVYTIRDLLYFFPHRHIDYSQRVSINTLVVGAENTIIANVWESREVQLGTRRSAEATVGDETGNIRIVWFNQPFMAKTLKAGQKIVISGHVSIFAGMPVFESPEWESYDDKDLVHTGRWVPIYPLTQGLGQRQIRRIIKPAIDQWANLLDEFLPSDLTARLNLLGLSEAIHQAHYPQSYDIKNESRRRLAFDELFLLQLGVMTKKRNWQQCKPGIPIATNRPELNIFLNSLPFKLTEGQNKALMDILEDLKGDRAMSRLLQGEVGSGKTIVAAAALILTVSSGYQAAMMAPTEILAQQHFSTLRRLLSQVGKEEGESNCFTYTGFLSKPLKIALLQGDIKQSKKLNAQEQISSGEIDIVIGTQALIQKKVSYNKLALIVVDEQHRFGVEQRYALRQKGANPHVLVMTATPIPRTLALTLYGDLDLSIINELPPGRQHIKTKWLKPEQRTSAYNFIRQQVQKGQQAYIICPFVEESDVIQAKAAIQEYEQLAHQVFPDLHLGLLHGRLSAKAKEEAMQQFNSRALDILVSTPVIEVGIDIPNATVMLIESADRFGLSQLHQFRGRIGRGHEQSYCMLLAEKPSDIGKKRLDLIEKIYNGFVLAEEDLKLRGPGEFFGTRQSGLPDLKMARLSDLAILEIARKEAENLFNIDPDLKKAEHFLLAKELERVWKNDVSLLV